MGWLEGGPQRGQQRDADGVKGKKCGIRNDFKDVALSDSTSLPEILGKAQFKRKI